MVSDRRWIDNRMRNDILTYEFRDGIEEFVAVASQHKDLMDGDKIRCPCNARKCRNTSFHLPDEVRYHLASNGFVPNYYIWYKHGEIDNKLTMEHREVNFYNQNMNGQTIDAYQAMVFDAGGPSFRPYYICDATMGHSITQKGHAESSAHASLGTTHAGQQCNVENTHKPDGQYLFQMLEAAQQEVWPGNPFGHSKLSAVARLLNMKAEHHFSESCYDDICQLISELLPTDNEMTDSFYSTKKLMHGLGLPVQKIHCCINGCMIYWGSEDCDLMRCKICSHPRFKPEGRGHRKGNVAFKKMYYFPLSPRLQRLYASSVTAKEMRWHAEHEVEADGIMRHCSDSIAWKHFDQQYPQFASEVRNIRLGLCTDGFQPFGQSGQQYSSWPVIVTPYNLPPWMCMKDEYMFLSIIVPGPRSPKEKLDIYLQPLIMELQYLWDTGVNTFDTFTNQNFLMKAALMWTISDFPAYAMLSGWSTAGKLACPYCMNDSDAFSLKHGRKTCWFDSHRKFLPKQHPFRRNKKYFIKGRVVHDVAPPIRSGYEILAEMEALGLKKVTEPNGHLHNLQIGKNFSCGWRKRSIFWDLPYWKTHIIRHNLDVMHIEKNFFDNIFNTIMNVDGKTKDNAKSREDLIEVCSRPELHKDECTNKYPKACYTLEKKAKEALCEWLQGLRFPDGYASNLGRCVDSRRLQLYGMKSHDCHVFMQRLLPIAVRELLPPAVWQCLTELSNFFKDLTSTVITASEMDRLNNDIPLILCKLERIFPPSFFDSMEHLPVHLAYEAKMAGPVQYRWMYPFERFIMFKFEFSTSKFIFTKSNFTSYVFILLSIEYLML